LTEAKVGAVDVYVLRRAGDEWQVLLLQRTAGTRCPGSWEAVHGRIEPGERPEEAALREVREETGLEAERLYNVTVQAFYLHTANAVMLAVVFAAIVRDPAAVTLGPEHERAEWLGIPEATARYTWPRSRAVLAEIAHLLRGGDAGAAEDVLRVK
jgi:dATP pyrophosphohydrolase